MLEPLRKVNPRRIAPLVSHAQRIEVEPLVVPGCQRPSMIVAAGPFMLASTTALSRATRFVIELAGVDLSLPPTAYTPFVARIQSPSIAASTASCRTAAADAQFV